MSNQKKVKPVLEQKIIFIKDVIPYDYTNTMGQLAMDIIYTNGDNQVFTTMSKNPNCFGTYEFETDEDFYEYFSFIKNNLGKK